MNIDEQVDEILARAVVLFEPEDPSEVELFRKDVRGSLEAGWSRHDILKFMSYTEEMCYPDTEESALHYMKIICDDNETTFGGRRK